MERQSIVACEGKISRLYINSNDNEDYFHVSVLSGKKGSKIFSIKKLNENYFIEGMYGIPYFQELTLRPETEYEIRNCSN